MFARAQTAYIVQLHFVICAHYDILSKNGNMYVEIQLDHLDKNIDTKEGRKRNIVTKEGRKRNIGTKEGRKNTFTVILAHFCLLSMRKKSFLLDFYSLQNTIITYYRKRNQRDIIYKMKIY